MLIAKTVPRNITRTSANMPVIVIRPAMIYGPGDLRFLKLFKMIARKHSFMIGSGKTLAHFVYIDDLLDGFVLASSAADREGEIYIIASEGPIALNDLVRIICDELGVSVPKIHLPVKPFQWLGSICETVCLPLKVEPPIFRRRVDFFTKNRAFDINKAKRDLKYEYKVGMREGIRRTLRWYREKEYL